MSGADRAATGSPFIQLACYDEHLAVCLDAPLSPAQGLLGRHALTAPSGDVR